jgi:hypothetical protein
VTQVELQEAEQRVKRILGSVDAADDVYIVSAPDPPKQQAIASPADVMAMYAKWREEHDSQMVGEITEAQESPRVAVDARKKPRHVSVAINHLLAQRSKAIKVRDKAAEEVESLDAALLALGWGE